MHGEQLKREEPTEMPAGEKTPEKTEEKKPAAKMDPITVMRGEMCWSREKLIGHDGCMEWLTEECTTKSAGTGLCNRVTKHVKSKCIDEQNKKACHYAKKMGIIVDSDDDGVQDKDDAFPKDPKEWKDTDGDGVGDNADECPNDPEYQKKPCFTTTTTTTPPPTTTTAVKEETAAPTTAAPTTAAPESKKESTEKPKAYVDPDAKKGLQSQGFSGKKVVHVDGETLVSDWGNEYGHKEEGSKPKKSGTTRLWQPHALIMALGALTLAYAA